MVIYSSSSSTTDVTDPEAPTSLSSGTITSSSVQINWVNGSDAGEGILNSVILRTATTSESTVSLNDQGEYSTSGGSSGPNTIGDWTILSTSVSPSATTFTDSTVAAGTSYKYAVIHFDRAYNYSTALVSSTWITPISWLAPLDSMRNQTPVGSRL